MSMQIPEQVPLDRPLCELEGHAASPLVPYDELHGLSAYYSQAESVPLSDLTSNDLRLLLGQWTGTPWILRPILGLVAHDPLLSNMYAGDLLDRLTGPLFADCWRANPLDAEIVRRACARVGRLAGDPDEWVALDAEFAIETMTKQGHWPWSPPPELDAPERWRMPDAAPLERSIEELAGRGLEPMRPESPVTARLGPALARPIGELTREQVRFLLEEHYGLPWLLPLALRWVEEDPLELTARHPGGTLIALLDLRFAVVWRTNPDLIERLRAVLARLEAAAADPDPLISQGPRALLQRLQERRLQPWSPSPL